MIVYSVTVSIATAMEAEWLPWMQAHHIPDVMKTGFFLESHIQRLLDPTPDEGVSTFNIQYLAPDMAAYEQYQQTAAPALQQEHTDRYKDRFVAFRTILERL